MSFHCDCHSCPVTQNLLSGLPLPTFLTSVSLSFWPLSSVIAPEHGVFSLPLSRPSCDSESSIWPSSSWISYLNFFSSVMPQTVVSFHWDCHGNLVTQNILSDLLLLTVLTSISVCFWHLSSVIPLDHGVFSLRPSQPSCDSESYIWSSSSDISYLKFSVSDIFLLS